MECKNCLKRLRTDYSFCPNCGAKIIRNRITFKNLWYDFTERFFNLDNTFLRTFIDLFKRPEAVIGGYIDGVRKRYMNPVSYFMIAVAVGGLFVFLSRNVFPDAMDFESNPITKSAGIANQPGAELGAKFNNYILDYQNLFYVAMIPILALISRLVFIDKKKYNLSEHFVINLFGYSQMSICINLIYFTVLWNPKIFMLISTLGSFLQIAYFSYVFKRLYQLSIGQILLKLLIFIAVLGVVFVIVVVLMGLYMLMDPEFLEQIRAAKEVS